MAYTQALYFRAAPLDQRQEETRNGVPLFDGNARDLSVWKFKVLTRQNALNAISDDKIKKEKILRSSYTLAETTRDS